MTSFIVITIVIVAVAGILGYVIQLNRKPKQAAPVVAAKKTFHIIVNYVTSFIKTYGNTDYVFLNISIENKSQHDMEDITIETIPEMPIITDLRFKAISEKWTVDSHDPVFSDSIISRVMNVEPGQTVSGYLVVATRNTQCNIDGISITSNDEVQQIPLRKERIMFKTNSLRKF